MILLVFFLEGVLNLIFFLLFENLSWFVYWFLWNFEGLMSFLLFDKLLFGELQLELKFEFFLVFVGFALVGLFGITNNSAVVIVIWYLEFRGAD